MPAAELADSRSRFAAFEARAARKILRWRRTLAGRYKKRRHDTVPLPEPDSDNASLPGSVSRDPDPHLAYECNETLERMEHAIREDLTPEQRLLFQLHHLQDRSIQEIARALDKSEDSVKSHLYRARKALLAR